MALWKLTLQSPFCRHILKNADSGVEPGPLPFNKSLGQLLNYLSNSRELLTLHQQKCQRGTRFALCDTTTRDQDHCSGVARKYLSRTISSSFLNYQLPCEVFPTKRSVKGMMSRATEDSAWGWGLHCMISQIPSDMTLWLSKNMEIVEKGKPQMQSLGHFKQ